MSLFLYLPTLALCAVVLGGVVLLGYRIAIDALDNAVRGPKPGDSWERVDGCAWCEDAA